MHNQCEKNSKLYRIVVVNASKCLFIFLVNTPGTVFRQKQTVDFGRVMVHRKERMRHLMSKLLSLIPCFLAVALFCAVVMFLPFKPAVHMIVNMQWIFGLLCCLRLSNVLGAFWGWVMLFPCCSTSLVWCLCRLRFIREGVNTLLPAAQIGGDLIAMRLLNVRLQDRCKAIIYVVLDLFALIITQILFTVFSLGLLLFERGIHSELDTLYFGLIGAITMAGGLIILYTSKGQRLIYRMIELFLTSSAKTIGSVEAFYESLRQALRSRKPLIYSCVVHFITWLLGALEPLIIFYSLGHPISIVDALIIESVYHAIKGASFLVPGALGIQESAMVSLGLLLGVNSEIGLAFSLIKRCLDLAIGLPGLGLWIKE